MTNTKLPPHRPVPELGSTLNRLLTLVHRKGELWERCQGKGWPDAESEEFTKLRDETIPALIAQLQGALATQADMPSPRFTLAQVEDAYRAGFNAPATYNDKVENDEDEEWLNYLLAHLAGCNCRKGHTMTIESSSDWYEGMTEKHYDLAVSRAVAAAIVAHEAQKVPQSVRERWNVEQDGDDLLVCFNDHEKGEHCEYVRYSPTTHAAVLQDGQRALVELYLALCDAMGYSGRADDLQSPEEFASALAGLATVAKQEPVAGVENLNWVLRQCIFGDFMGDAPDHLRRALAARSELAHLTVAPELDVRKIMLGVVPGEDGMGEEVYATSVADVESVLGKMGEELEDWRLGIKRYPAPVQETWESDPTCINKDTP